MTNKKIYILCPPKRATGEPEALHQLGFELKKLGADVKMFYSRLKIDPVHPFYKRYKIPHTQTLKDSKDIILVIPESMTNWIARFPLAEKKIWWLSLDFYQVQMDGRERKKNWIRSIVAAHKHNEYRFEHVENLEHIHQSQRVRSFLDEKNISSVYLCDYVDDLFFEGLNEEKLKSEKQDIITYNPKKGFEIIKDIVQKLESQYTLIPLQGFTRTEMRDVLRKAKLHIDFGYFPGRDKIPREALVSMCSLITGRNGTSGLPEDLGIPEKYKINVETELDESILNKINFLMQNYDTEIETFFPFRQFVMNEKSRMIIDLKDIFSS